MSNTKKASLLTLQNICAGYGKREIIRDISIELYTGEFCALLGLNGSGKTTLLKAVSGLIPVKTGAIKAGDTDITKMGEKKRAGYISYIPQRHSKFIGMSVFDVVSMGENASMGIFEIPTNKSKNDVICALKKVGIESLLSEIFSQLSEGQKQLVILARTLVQDTPVMLMDEPDSALDFSNKHRILNKIREIVQKEKKTGLVTLHDPNLALKYCDRIILIKDGKSISEIKTHEHEQADIRSYMREVYDDIEVTQIPTGEYCCTTFLRGQDE